jgi:hypothetical protein
MNNSGRTLWVLQIFPKENPFIINIFLSIDIVWNFEK